MNEWYNTLTKPPLTPPASYFPVAWGILYTLMTIAFFVILSKPHSQDKYIAVNLFLFQLVLNFTWSYVFFEMKSISLGLLDVIFLLILLIFTVIYFFKLSKLAGILLIPYLLQVIFALYLNLGFLILN
ncbi:tryptophan-rich sensory protein [bacterium]|nr:tryptophan-rich sensory protein [bacterium]